MGLYDTIASLFGAAPSSPPPAPTPLGPLTQADFARMLDEQKALRQSEMLTAIGSALLSSQKPGLGAFGDAGAAALQVGRAGRDKETELRMAAAKLAPEFTLPGAQLSVPTSRTGAPGPISTPGQQTATPSFADRVAAIESAGDPNAKNPRSSATGAGQFIGSTWLDLMKDAMPDLADGKTDAQLLEMRKDPALSRKMIDIYAEQNKRVLESKGIDPTDANLYLAHFLGPYGAMAVLTAKDDAPVDDYLDAAAIRANPILQGRSTGDIKRWAERKMMRAAPQGTATTVLPQGMTRQQARQQGVDLQFYRNRSGQFDTDGMPQGYARARDPQTGQDIAARIPGVPEDLSSYAKTARDMGFSPGTPEFQRKVEELATRAQTQVNIDQRGETKFEESYQKQAGEQAAAIITNADKARQQQVQLDRLNALMREFETGRLAPVRSTAAAWGQALGLSPQALETIGVNPNDAMNAEGITAITNALTTSLIGGEGFPANNFSDADRNFLMSTMPQLSTTPGGNRIIVQALQRAADRAVEKETLWLEYRQNGKSYDDFRRDWNNKVRNEPIFPSVATREERDALPPGTVYTAPDGTVMVKQQVTQ